MRVCRTIIINFCLFSFLTLLTQVGGLVYIFSIFLINYIPVIKQAKIKYKRTLLFIVGYSVTTFIIIPISAPSISEREPVKHQSNLKPTTYLTVLLNRNYVRPELNDLLTNTAKKLEKTNIQINYLDASFPFINGFPLFPHLSHNDGKKIDLSYVYQNPDGSISKEQKSVSGFGVFIEAKGSEVNMNQHCMKQNVLYDYSKYLHFGKINDELVFSNSGTKQLVKTLISNENMGKLFIEPHLAQRMGLLQGGASKIRFQGCYSVRHDDHIHIQLK